ncbi:hypothetical protein [Nocardioides bizhenqiangii]|uniref:Uncharacterized protein n=1 Tax=Nocardioides bizhenqiangii TaxID=3095076 RepID=A0ABZ0ZR75_9ACTN|nr:hypothetical protein [Nocardioides sp. HM61]WQQ26848.1 hypothetical protein SHK19_01120 [Nocardioides sp. HM61]
MTDDQYVLGFILMAIAIALILGLGTLRMAGMLQRHQRTEADEQQRRGHKAEHHHWYDRFHLHGAA